MRRGLRCGQTRLEVRGQIAEVRGQIAEVRGQIAEVRGQIAEVTLGVFTPAI
jgi:hypothetical protein